MHGDLTRLGNYLEGAGFPVAGNKIEKAIHCRLGAQLRMQALGAPNLETFSGRPAVQPPPTSDSLTDSPVNRHTQQGALHIGIKGVAVTAAVIIIIILQVAKTGKR